MSRNKFYDKTILQIKARFKDNTALDILDNMQAVYEAKDSDYSATGLPMGNLRKCEDAGIDVHRGAGEDGGVLLGDGGGCRARQVRGVGRLMVPR